MMNWAYGYDGMMGSFGMGGFLFMVLWWALVAYAIVWIVRQIGHSGGSRHERAHRPSALDILKERYAKGEIDKKEFEEKKKDLVG